MNRVLVIDDDDTVRSLLKALLQDLGYEVTSACDGREGIEIFHRVSIDLVITDIILPYLDGHEICRRIKVDHQLSHIPIIMLTARDLDEDEALAKQSGADAFLVKTTHASIVLDVIKKLLERYS